MKGHLLGKLHGELVLAFGLDLHGALLVDLLHVVEHLKELPSMDPRCNVAQAGKHIRDQNGRRPLPTQVHRSHPPTPTQPNPTHTLKPQPNSTRINVRARLPCSCRSCCAPPCWDGCHGDRRDQVCTRTPSAHGASSGAALPSAYARMKERWIAASSRSMSMLGATGFIFLLPAPAAAPVLRRFHRP